MPAPVAPETDARPPAPQPDKTTRGPGAGVATWMLGVVVVVAVTATWFGGGLAALDGFDDGGALARWGIPVAKAMHDIAASLTLGLLLLAGTIIPERKNTDRRRTACRVAVGTGTVWVIAGSMYLLLLLSNISGIAVSSPLFAGQLPMIWQIELFRVYFFSILFAIGSTLLAAVARTTVSITWGAALAVVSLAILSLAGHAAGAAAHDTAVNALAVHIIGAAVWLGGLGALVILRRPLGKDFGISVERYSVLAGWCYAGVLASGVLSASLRIGTPADLTTPYGTILGVKVLAIGLLGLAGWRMRRRFVGKLTENVANRWAFAQLAMVELTLMALAIGAGVGLSRSAPPISQEESADVAVSITGYPLPDGPVTGLGWFTTFRIDWLWFTVAVLASALYLAGVLRLRKRGDSWPVLRTIAWIAGWLVFVWVTSGAPGVYGRVMFSAHMLMHMTLAMGIPLFLVLGAPLTLAARALKARPDKTLGPREFILETSHSRWMKVWTTPIVAAINFVGSLYLFYFTDLFGLALDTHVGHVAMVIHFMASGYVFAWSLIGIDPGPNRWPPSLRLVLLFVSMSFHAFFGVAIMTSTAVLADNIFTRLAVPWVPDLLADQKVGGGITWGIGEIPMLFLALAVAVVWMRTDEKEAKRSDRQAERDHDAELEAYNAHLAELARQDRADRERS